MSAPLEIGITGGIGSGKSLVCEIFSRFGAPVYDADSRAKKLMTTDGILIEQIKKEFGMLSYREDGSLDRTYISGLVFRDPERLIKLNSFVHPRVALDYSEWIKGQAGRSYVLREAALLYEAGVHGSMGKMIVVSAPEELRLKRVLKRDPHRSEQDVRSIMKSQWPEAEKLKRADYVIYNDDKQMVLPQVLRLHQAFTTHPN